MKLPLLLLFLISTFNGYSQESESTDEKLITQTVNRFFESLEKKDTALLKSATMPQGQVWRIYNDDRSEPADMRFFKDDIATLSTLPQVKETATSFEIKINKDIAMAWVPYGFWVKEQFSHCGIDVFTLFRIDGEWKIMSAAYSVEKENCGELMGEE